MKLQFSNDVITHILEQSIIYTCACPAQICKAINEQRALFAYQQKCLNLTDTDKSVHETIAKAVETVHAELESCLEAVLQLEGWDMATYQMPDNLQKKLLCELEDSFKTDIEK
jgi:hypothetical protein